MKIWTFTTSGESAGDRQAPGPRDAGTDVPCAVAIDSAGEDLRGFELRGYGTKVQRGGSFSIKEGSRRRGRVPGFPALRLSFLDLQLGREPTRPKTAIPCQSADLNGPQ